MAIKYRAMKLMIKQSNNGGREGLAASNKE